LYRSLCFSCFRPHSANTDIDAPTETWKAVAFIHPSFARMRRTVQPHVVETVRTASAKTTGAHVRIMAALLNG
jgi:hypothetical protein